MKFIFALLIISTVLLTACTSGNPSVPSGKYDAFAECLTTKGATMYGTEWCPHCKTQKEMFGDSFKLVNYVDCDRYQNECIGAGVEGYPTWKINGQLYPGTQNLYVLAKNSGCEAELTSAE